MITTAHVVQRYAEFLSKYQSVLELLNFDTDYITKSVANLSQRLNSRDFKRYGDKPVHFLHAGKRLTRTYIRWAIERSPARKAMIARLRQQYSEEYKVNENRVPSAPMASFEAHFAKQLRVNVSKHRKLFYI